MNPTDAVLMENDTFCSEAVFQHLLILERKKTERSSRPFMLLLLNVEHLLRESKRPKEIVKQALADSLKESTREIDVKGWYRQDSLIGIICTEANRGKKDAIVSKIKSKLLKFFGPDEVKLIRLYIMDYPEYEARINPNSSSNLIRELKPERKGMFYS